MDNDVIDTTVFSELQSSTGADFVSELVTTFLEEAPRLLIDLRQAHAEQDGDRFRRIAHSLKSNAQTFGARNMAAEARILERDGLTVGAAENAGGVTALEMAYARVATSLKDLAHV
jgi:histidine phosphotransfer protein HptB